MADCLILPLQLQMGLTRVGPSSYGYLYLETLHKVLRVNPGGLTLAEMLIVV